MDWTLPRLKQRPRRGREGNAMTLPGHGAACSSFPRPWAGLASHVPSGMSGLQPGLALNEKQAGRPGHLLVRSGQGRHGGHTGCAWRPSLRQGRRGGPSSRFGPAPARREEGRPRLEADGAHSASASPPPPPAPATLGTKWFGELRFSCIENVSNDTLRGGGRSCLVAQSWRALVTPHRLLTLGKIRQAGPMPGLELRFREG